MPVVRPWYVIPALGLASVGVALAQTRDVELAIALGLCGAALAAAIRAFLGPSVVAAIAAAGGGALGVLGLLALAVHRRDAVAAAAGLFALSELVRAKQPHDSPLPAVGAALLAGCLDPSYLGLVAVSGIAWLRAPVAQPRGVIVLPILGGLACVMAVVAAFAPGHTWMRLWHAWTGHTQHHTSPLTTLLHAGDLVGPLAAFAALAGLVTCLAHGRHAAAAVASLVALGAVVSLANGVVAPVTPLVAALAAGVAIGRLAALVRWPVGQTFVGATAGFILVVVPAWALIAPAS